MPAATVTVRELKNADTGIDITVPSFKESKGLLQSSYEFNVVVVSKHHFFKSTKHKETDVVQFMVTKKLSDFEDLNTKITNKYPATLLPPLPRKSLLVNDTVARERRNVLENYMKSIASTPKLSTCSILLQFLGVNAMKAGKYRADKLEKKSLDSTETSQLDKPTQEQSDSSNIFEDEEEEPSELFAETETDANPETVASLDKIKTKTDDTKLFDDPDLGGALREGENEDLFIAEAETESKINFNVDPDDKDLELLTIEDDIETVLQLDEKKGLPGSSSISHPVAASKPAIKPRPKPKPAAKPKNKDISADTLETSDILQYIQQNESEKEVDLFS